MAERQEYRYTVTVEAAQHGRGAMLTWSVYRARMDDPLRALWKSRRVLIASTGKLNVPQLTALAQRMVAYVLASTAGHAQVPRGLPWREVGKTAWAVPPGGGEGGASPQWGTPVPTQPNGHQDLTEGRM